MRAYRTPKEDRRRAEQIESALAAAASVPLATAAAGIELLRLLTELAPHTTPRVGSDVGVAIRLGKAAVESALLNVAINLASMKDRSRRDELQADHDRIAVEAERLAEAALRAADEKES
ncbi:formiminotransferase-cyclodeaminase, partial [Candidatus Acetothermia bacterium]